MKVKRIVPNFDASDVAKARQFYAEVLGLEVVMDQGWIVTLAASTKMAPQITIANEGGSGTGGRIFPWRSTTWTKHCAGFACSGSRWSTDRQASPGTCVGFMSAIRSAAWSTFSSTSNGLAPLNRPPFRSCPYVTIAA
jgi:hypothetical protein